MNQTARSFSHTTPEILVPFLGLMYVGLLLVYAAIEGFQPGGFLVGDPSVAIGIVIIAVVSLVLALFVWRGNRIGYLASMAVSVIFIIQFYNQLQAGLTGFSSEFVEVITAIPTLVLVFIYSLLGVRKVWRRNGGISVLQSHPKMMPVSSTLALVVVGFMIGATTISVVASTDIQSVVANSVTNANIVIEPGSGNPNNGIFFSPAVYNVTVGQTIVWMNKDTVTHTIVSTSVPNGASSFNSGDLSSGQEFRWTFTMAGIYQYYCSIHPFIKGTIIVIG